MNILETVALMLVGIGIFLFFFLMLPNAILFYVLHYDNVSKKIDGHVFDGGFLFSSMRFGPWGFYCLSESLARRNGVDGVFQSLPKFARYQLIFHSLGVAFGSLVLLACGVLVLLGKL